MTDQSHTPLLPCPFCGETKFLSFETDQIGKWGWVVCGCDGRGPDVRTGYEKSGWQEYATAQWNTRSVNSLPSLVKALEEARQWVEANTAQVRGLSSQAAEPGETMLKKIDAALSAYRGDGK